MSTELLAAPVVDMIYQNLRPRIEAFKKSSGRVPKLAVVLVGSDPASTIYTRKKGEVAISLGMEHESLHFSSTVSSSEVRAAVSRLNSDSKIDGILIQRPLPASFVEGEVLEWVVPHKDVDAFHPHNVGRLFLGMPGHQPCTPAGVMRLLTHYKIPISGKIACVIGRSSIVGRPMASLLLQADATVIHCHSKTKDLKTLSQQADLLIVAAGKPGLVDATFLKMGAVVVDVGIHRNAQGKVIGDVDAVSISEKASAFTPVPGGVGPMTIAMLMENTVKSAETSL